MTVESWLFSAKRAWQSLAVRIVTVVTMLCVFTTSIWFSARIIGLRHASEGIIVLHYNIDFGIDKIGAWGWGLLFPLVWVLITLVDFWWAFGIYREDVYQAWAFFSLAMAWSIPWMMALWHLIRINV